MRRYHHLVEGILGPTEINDLQKIFDLVIAQPWFDLNDLHGEAFAADLIKLYRGGVVHFDRLHHLATLTALVHFSRDMPEEQRRAMHLLNNAQFTLDESQSLARRKRTREHRDGDTGGK
jgi:hypothetical protein